MIHRICCAARIRQSAKFIAIFAAVLSLAIFNTATTMALSITSVEVEKGPTAGGNEVIIRGDGFFRTISQQDKIIQLAGATNPNESPYGTVVALTQSGKVYAYGNNQFGSAGTGVSCIQPISEDRSGSDMSEPCYYNTPQDITSMFGGKVNGIYQITTSFNDYHKIATNFALTDSGDVYTWGATSGTFNDPNTDNPILVRPTIINELSNKGITNATVDELSGTIAFNSDTHVIIAYDTDDAQAPTWIDLNLSSQLKNDQTIKQMPAAGNFDLIVTNDNHLLQINGDQCIEENSTKSTLETTLPDCVQLTDITSRFGKEVAQAHYDYVLNSDGQLYYFNNDMAVSVANNVDAEVPRFTNIFGYYDNYDNGDHYDGVLALSDDGKVYSIGLLIDDYSLLDNDSTRGASPFQVTEIPELNDISVINDAIITRYDGIKIKISYTTNTESNIVHSYLRIIVPPSRSGDSNADATFYEATIPLETTSARIPTVKAISFGDVTTTDFTTVDNNTIKAIVPAHAVGKVDVVLHSIDGEASNVTLTKGYEYIADTAVGAPNTGLGIITKHPAIVLGIGAIVALAFAKVTKRRQT